MNFILLLKGCTLWRKIFAISTGSIILLLNTLVGCEEAQASLILDQNRVVLSANEGAAIVKVDNPTDRDYLIQNWITAEDNSTQEALFVQPPLVKIKAHHKVALHIEAIDPAIAGETQEKLYRLNVKEIPKVENKGGSQLLLVMLTKIKILYRPTAVNAEMDQAYQKLTWHKAGNALRVDNPTPYYVTFDKVWEENNKTHPLDADTIAPHSTLTIKGYRGAANIYYSIINDYGDASDAIKVSL